MILPGAGGKSKTPSRLADALVVFPSDTAEFDSFWGLADDRDFVPYFTIFAGKLGALWPQLAVRAGTEVQNSPGLVGIRLVGK